MKKLKLYTKTFYGDTETPIRIFMKYTKDSKGFMLESRGNGKSNFSFIGRNPKAVLSGTDKLTIEENGAKRTVSGKLLDGVRDYLKDYDVETDLDTSFIGGAVGVIGYDVIKQYEKIPDLNPDVINTPTVHLMVFTEFIIYEHMHDKIILAAIDENNEKGEKNAQSALSEMEKALKEELKQNVYDIPESDEEITVTSNMTEDSYKEIVEKAKKYIYDGDIFQVVLSQRLTAKTNQNPFTLYRKLRAINPSPYLYYFNFGDYQVAGSSPEMLVELTGNRIKTCPIAGTRKRGRTAAEDEMLANSMLNDPKEIAEHIMLVDLARNDMGRVSKIGSVEVTQFKRIQYYSHVMHLVSLVEGEKKDGLDSFDVLSTFLPAGTLSGAPKIRAMEIIEELEVHKRGVYGGAAGYFSFNGNLDMCIAIRTMVIKDGNIYMQAGAGIVADSIPKNEFEESHNKIRALVKTIGGDI